MSKPIVTIQGKKKKLSLSIDQESVNIYVDNGPTKEPLHVVYWLLDEVKEDENVAISIANAINLYHTKPQQLINLLGLK